MRKANRLAALTMALCVLCSIWGIPAFASEANESVPEIGGESTGITAVGEVRLGFRSPTGSINDVSEQNAVSDAEGEGSDLSEGLINGAYPVAPNGMTYGTITQHAITGTYPDLIAVSPSEDVHGYVKLEDLSPIRYMVQSGASTEEMNAYIENIGGSEGSRVMPVYDLDMNIIGEFESRPGSLDISGDTLEEIQDALAAAEEESETKQENPFTDVSKSSPFYDAILWAVEQNITNGTTSTTFSPNNTCSVSNILTFLWRANGKPDAAVGTADRDSAAGWAVEQGMIQHGYDVNNPCTRAMAVTFMWKAAGSPKADTQVSFSDVPAKADYLPAVAWALKQGITTGTSSSTFAPDTACTRGQIATFLYRGLAG